MLKVIIVIYIGCSVLWTVFLERMEWKQYQKPLPPEVSGVYDADRYADFIQYRKDYLKPDLILDIISLIITLFVMLSPFFRQMEILAGGNVYRSAFLTTVILQCVSLICHIPYEYYTTFVIEERYGKNKATHGRFWKDLVVGQVETFALSLLVILGVAWMGEMLASRFRGQTITFRTAVLIMGILLAAFMVLMLLATGISLVSLKLQYRFSDMEPGPLRDRIMVLTEGSRKKIRRIRVYNESAKSNGKNAFLLQFLWFREFGIADNFLNENDEEELMAVLAHEAGHLKHRKDGFDLLKYGIAVLFLAVVFVLILHAGSLGTAIRYVNRSFGLRHTSYYLLLDLFAMILNVVKLPFSLYTNWLSRRNEEEADLNAVKEGYGAALITTFTKLSQDELVDVNPAPLIEKLEYDHPSMYHRIRYIREAMREEGEIARTK